MRSLSLVDRVFFKDIYTSNSRNLCLYDVDNDGVICGIIIPYLYSYLSISPCFTRFKLICDVDDDI